VKEMASVSYLEWLSAETPTAWWYDSADPCGATTNLARPREVVRRLQSVSEFRKAYEVDGLQEREFISFGLTQKTLSQFSFIWRGLRYCHPAEGKL